MKSIFRDCCPKHVNYKENVLEIVLSTTKECKVEYVLGIFSIYCKFIFWSLYFVESLSIGKNLFEKNGFWHMNRFVIVLICPFCRSFTLPWFLETLLILLIMHEKNKYLRVCSSDKMIPLQNNTALIFISLSKVTLCYITGQWGEFRIKNALFGLFLFFFFLFHHKIFVFINFISFFDELAEY